MTAAERIARNMQAMCHTAYAMGSCVPNEEIRIRWQKHAAIMSKRMREILGIE